MKVGGFDLGVSEVHELLLLILHLKENRKLLTAHDVSLIIYDFFDNGRKSLLSRVCESLLGMCEREILQGMAQEVLKMMSMKIVEKEWGNRNDNPQTRVCIYNSSFYLLIAHEFRILGNTKCN